MASNNIPVLPQRVVKMEPVSPPITPLEIKMESITAPNSITVYMDFSPQIIRFMLDRFPDLDCKTIQCDSAQALLITRTNHVYLPTEASLGLSLDPNETQNPKSDTESANTRLLNVCINPVRIVITQTDLTASLQVFQIEVERVTDILQFNNHAWVVSDKLQPLLNKVSAAGGYEFCRGVLPREALENGDVETAPVQLEVIRKPFLRLLSKTCQQFTKQGRNNFVQDESSIVKLGRAYRCVSCREWVTRRNKWVQNGSKWVEPSSNYPISGLKPRDLKQRIQNMKLERKNMIRTIKELKSKLIKSKMATEKDLDKYIVSTDESD